MNQNPFRPPQRQILTPEQAAIKRNSETMERELIFGMIRSRRFYRHTRNFVCVWNAERQNYRLDFTISRYNDLYQALDYCHRIFDSLPLLNDIAIPPLRLAARIIDLGNQKALSSEIVNRLIKEIQEEVPLAATITYESSIALTKSASFEFWLANRLSDHAMAHMNALKSIGKFTPDQFDKILQAMKTALALATEDPPQSLGELTITPESTAMELIGPKRFLSRGGILLVVGSTGIGKSTFTLQMAVEFALGREFFGMRPNGVLKTLIIQAENDAAEMIEFRDGIFKALKLSEEDCRSAGGIIFVKQSIGFCGSEFISKVLAPYLNLCRPDLVLIDPALAFLGGDVKEQSDVGKFLRTQLMPLLVEFNCGCILTHHTNKPNVTHDRSAEQMDIGAYAGSGSAEFANVSRAVITLKDLNARGIFELTVPKRGKRLGWKEADGETLTTKKYIRHSREPGEICWIDSNEEEVQQAKTAGTQQGEAAIDEKMLALIPSGDGIGKNDLLDLAKEKKMNKKSVESALHRLIDRGLITRVEKSRPGARAAIWYVAIPQNEPGRNVNGQGSLLDQFDD